MSIYYVINDAINYFNPQQLAVYCGHLTLKVRFIAHFSLGTAPDVIDHAGRALFIKCVITAKAHIQHVTMATRQVW